ncbi:hypothetical protein FIU86_18585 [Roseovarius sp. THAF9]|uniref:hypothetical protein n=1 Tax=Roseovarius sp. THAF9 TaxID=2587847 RepID=UPI001267E8E5|nr:hypothetical protein [Roseovarius sp. THAF9]QFT94864.1 hypothetical protein FIU86_18585 [Roseovarius sp. THAF9]
MRQPPTYPAIEGLRGTSVLPQDAQRTIREFGTAIANGDDLSGHAARYCDAVADLPANAMPRAEQDIIAMARLYTQETPTGDFRWRDAIRTLFKGPRPAEKASVTAQSALLFLHHSDGHLREAALNTLQLAPQNSFDLAVLVHRLRDWVPEVRAAAQAYLARIAVELDPDLVAENVLFLLANGHNIISEPEHSPGNLISACHRGDIARALTRHLAYVRTGTHGYALQQLLKQPLLDSRLPQLAQDAAHPGVRLVAYRTLLSGAARWLTGHRVDHSRTNRRRLPEYATRQVEIAVDADKILRQAAQDRSVKIRRLAADTLIEARTRAKSITDELARTLAQDKYPSVRERAETYLRKREGDT